MEDNTIFTSFRSVLVWSHGAFFAPGHVDANITFDGFHDKIFMPTAIQIIGTANAILILLSKYVNGSSTPLVCVTYSISPHSSPLLSKATPLAHLVAGAPLLPYNPLLREVHTELWRNKVPRGIAATSTTPITAVNTVSHPMLSSEVFASPSSLNLVIHASPSEHAVSPAGVSHTTPAGVPVSTAEGFEGGPTSGWNDTSGTTPPQPEQPRVPLYKRRWFIITSIVAALLGIALLFIILFPVIHAIIQLVVKRSQIDVERAVIMNATNNT